MVKKVIQDKPLALLCALWEKTKAEEHKQTNLRRNLEDNMLELIAPHGVVPTEGSTTLECDGFKIKLTAGLSYKVESPEGFTEALRDVPVGLRPVKEVIDEAGMKYLRSNEPAVYAKFSNCIVVTPRKVGFAIEPLNKE
jgi:hypothetical protein